MDFDERKRKQPEAFSHWILSNPDPRTGWELDKPQKYVSVRRKFYSRGDRNRHLDIYIKKAALKASRSIVCLESRIGEEELFQCTGTVMESHKNFSIILTSASLLRSSNVKKSENSEAKDIKIVVHLPDGKSIDGQVEGFDLHFNVAAIRIGESLPAASFTHVNDAMSVDPSEVHPSVLFHLPPYHSRSFNLIQGDQVIALGRFTVQPYELMAAPGEYCIDRCDFDDGFNCKELFKATCRITRCGIGGPLINRSAEVIGICFYDFSYTAFLPINVATLWWEHFKKYGEHRRPWLGMEGTNLYTTNLEILEKVIHKLPSIVNGVLVKEVKPSSAADSAGIKCNDVIVLCDGERVRSFLELFERIWHKVGKAVVLGVVRSSDKPNDDPCFCKMAVGEATSNDLYSWPLLEDVC